MSETGENNGNAVADDAVQGVVMNYGGLNLGDDVTLTRLLPLMEAWNVDPAGAAETSSFHPIIPILGFRRGGGRGNRHNPGGPGRGGGDGDHVDPELNFSSVGAQDKHVNFLKRSIIFPMKKPEEFAAWGIEPPKGVLFHGPPGTGKTLLAKSLSNELNKAMGKKVAFFYKKGSETNSKWFGESEENLRKLFDQAKRSAPSVIFFDEIDGLCPNRETSGQSSEAYDQVVTAMLSLIDSVNRGQVLIIGATNRLDAVDPAIRRPGRFDKTMEFMLPDEDGRKSIIRIHTKEWTKCQPDEELLEDLAKKTQGSSGADLEKLCKDAVWVARIRHGNEDLASLEVMNEDWQNAVGALKISPTAVFGSTIFVPLPVPDYTQPLTQEMLADVSAILEGWMPTKENPKEFPLPVIGMRSLLIYQEMPEADRFLHRVSMNAVLSSPTFADIPLHLMSYENLLDSRPFIRRAQRIVTTVKESREPCVLYVPRLDEVLTLFQGEQEGTNSLVTMLLSLRGSNCLLLATVTGLPALNFLRDGNNQLLFSQKVTVQNPSGEIRTEFYKPPFEGLIIPNKPKKKKQKNGKNANNGNGLTCAISEKFKKHRDNAVEISGERSPDAMVNLYDHLMRVRTENANEADEDVEFDYVKLEAEFARILDLFYEKQL